MYAQIIKTDTFQCMYDPKVTQNAGDLVSTEDCRIQPHVIARELPVRAPFIEVWRALLVLCATDDTTSWSCARQTIYTTGATIDGFGPWVGNRARETPIRSILAIVTGAFSSLI